MGELSRLTDVSRNCSTPEKSTISSNFRLISALVMPRIAPLRKTFSRPVSSGWNPVPTSNRDAMRPLTFTSPLAGAVTRERIFSNVLLPAPFRPIIPKISPCLTEKETSRKAQKSSENFSEVGGRRSEVGDRPPARRLRLGGRSESCPLTPDLFPPSSRFLPSPTFELGSSLPCSLASQRETSARKVPPPIAPRR